MTIVGDGRQTRDFTHIEDAITANIIAAFSEDKEILGEVFNIGTGKSYSILDISQMMGGDIIHIAKRPGEARNTLADTTKAHKLLGWKPLRTLENHIKTLTFS